MKEGRSLAENAATELNESITRAGFYPELVKAAVADGLLGFEPHAQLVHLETHIDNAEIHRHITVLALAADFLLVAHLDDQQMDEEGDSIVAHVNVETLPVSAVKSVGLSYSYPQPQNYEAGEHPAEVSLSISWTGGQRLDLQPAQCPDPTCTADHGYTGVAASEDIMLRVSAPADGAQAVENARNFAGYLRRAQLGVN